MFLAILFIPVVARGVLLESSSHRFPEITERKGGENAYGIFDPCRMDKPGEHAVSCSQLRRLGTDETDYYEINPHNKFRVKCDMESDGGGWTVIQRRGRYEQFDDKIFEKTYQEYENGFGEAARSYWIGNKNLHRLTSFPSRKQVLKIVLLLKDTGENITVLYDDFKVSSEKDKYMLTIGKYTGPEGYDALTAHNKGLFEIGDRVYQANPKVCHTIRSGGWWHSKCYLSNLNGLKFKFNSVQNKEDLGINWSKAGDENSFKVNYRQVEMMIREADFEFCMGNMAK